jgi:hypothetical protein
MSCSGSTRALVGAAIVLVVAACGSGAAAVNSPAASIAAAAAATPAPTPKATPSPVPTPSPTPSGTPRPVPGYGAVPSGWPSPMPVVPDSPLQDPPGQAIPTDLIGRQYNVDPPSVLGTQAEVLTLRPADDPHCKALYGGRSTCFTILWTPNYPNHVQTRPFVGPPGLSTATSSLRSTSSVRTLVRGTSATYKVSADLSTLDAVKPGCSYRRFIATDRRTSQPVPIWRTPSTRT